MKKTFCIIGVGLIGGSIALKLRKSSPGNEILGVDPNPRNAEYAATTGMVNRITDIEDAVRQSSFVILALPVDILAKMLPIVLDLVMGTDIVVTDTGSTKAEICEAVKNHPARKNFVAAHPIAGTEHAGPQFAFADLFEGKKCILCDEQNSSPVAIAIVKEFMNMLGMDIFSLDPIIHDRSYAYVSHLSHAIAYALGLSVLEMEKEIVGLRELSGTGFSSTVRLAKSSSKMWVPVLLQNEVETSRAIDSFISRLNELKTLMAEKDAAGLKRYIEKANEIGKFIGN